MAARRTLHWPITLGVVLIVLIVALTVGWVIVNVTAALQSTHAAAYWTVLAIGATLLVLVLVGVVMYLILSIKAIRLNQRQSNFIDAVTHELKSPIASLKLYLQTLNRRQVTAEQQADFHRFMLNDLQRLDHLIDHLLDAARLDQFAAPEVQQEVPIDDLLAGCAQVICQRYQLPLDTIKLNTEPAAVLGSRADLEIVFRNIIDNAVKYSGEHPDIEIGVFRADGRVITRIGDHGPGIPAPLRRKIFGRFVRLGSELERKASGTGLGLYIVRTLVKRMGGKIQVRSRPQSTGTIFEVDLPAAPVTQPAGTPAPDTNRHEAHSRG